MLKKMNKFLSLPSILFYFFDKQFSFFIMENIDEPRVKSLVDLIYKKLVNIDGSDIARIWNALPIFAQKYLIDYWFKLMCSGNIKNFPKEVINVIDTENEKYLLELCHAQHRTKLKEWIGNKGENLPCDICAPNDTRIMNYAPEETWPCYSSMFCSLSYRRKWHRCGIKKLFSGEIMGIAPNIKGGIKVGKLTVEFR